MKRMIKISAAFLTVAALSGCNSQPRCPEDVTLSMVGGTLVRDAYMFVAPGKRLKQLANAAGAGFVVESDESLKESREDQWIRGCYFD